MEQARRPYWRTLYFWVLVAIALGVAGRLAVARDRTGAEAARRRLHQAGQDDHHPGHLPHRRHRHCRHERLEGVRPGRAQGHGLFPHLLHPRAGNRPGGRQLRPSRRGAQRRSRDARYRRCRDLCRTGHTSRAYTGFLLNIIPDTLVSAFTEGEILQVLLVSILFGIALAMVGDRGERLLGGLKAITAVVFRMVHILMYAAPIGAFGAMAFTIGASWHRHPGESGRPDRDLLSHLAPVRDRRARPGRAGRRLFAARADPLHQGRAAARARHLLLRERDAAVDGEARARGLSQADRRSGRADRLFVQPRRHLHLHVAGSLVHRPGNQHRP